MSVLVQQQELKKTAKEWDVVFVQEQMRQDRNIDNSWPENAREMAKIAYECQSLMHEPQIVSLSNLTTPLLHAPILYKTNNVSRDFQDELFPISQRLL